MKSIIIGNIIGLIGSILMVYGGSVRKREKAIIIQTIQMSILSLNNLILGSISGFIINIINIIRNILSYKEKLYKPVITIIIIISTLLTIKFNALGLIGYLPLINSIIFILFMNNKSDIGFKILTIIYVIFWLVHDIYIKSYTTAFFDVLTILTSFYAIITLKIKKRQC